ncbi:MAG: hypothetical protein LAT79_17880 [Kiritimatiellae bacterium]|nr:hypothetical protein [Kiritimatiellia bacterium]
MTIFWGCMTCVGILIFLFPAILATITENQLILYPGYLFLNKPALFLELSNVKRIEAFTHTESCEREWFLKFCLYEKIELTELAEKQLRRADLRHLPQTDTEFYWSVAFPPGGVNALAQTLNQVVSTYHAEFGTESSPHQ